MTVNVQVGRLLQLNCALESLEGELELFLRRRLDDNIAREQLAKQTNGEVDDCWAERSHN